MEKEDDQEGEGRRKEEAHLEEDEKEGEQDNSNFIKKSRDEERRKEKISSEDKYQSQSKAKAVIFTPFTTNSELAKSLREAEVRLESLTGYKLKVVERAGSRLEDVLHRMNPWREEDCGREMCLL